jgi:hypothetical protein
MGIHFGNYENLFINLEKHSIDYIRIPQNIDENSFLISQKTAIVFRDEILVANLKQLGVETLLDVGCDFGSLIYLASENGILARGIDVKDSAINLSKAAKLDVLKHSIDQILANKSFESVALPQVPGRSSVSCLNILHGEWADAQDRDLFLEICLNNYDYVVITVTRDLFRHFRKKFKLTSYRFIGPSNRPIGKLSSQLSQYGTTFYLRGKLHLVECQFWRVMVGGRRFPNPINNYLRLTVVISSRIHSED